MVFKKFKNRIKNWHKKYQLNQISDYNNIDGWLLEDEALALFRIAKKIPNNSLSVEIGSWKGKSTFCISKGLKSGKLIAIDPFNASGGMDNESEKDYLRKVNNDSLKDVFISNMKRFNILNKIIIKEGYSYDFSDDIGEIDFLFIDGDHSIKGCVRDFKLYSPKVKTGGYIALHDYYKSRPELGPTYVVNELILKSNNFVFYGLYNSLWIAKKQR